MVVFYIHYMCVVSNCVQVISMLL